MPLVHNAQTWANVWRANFPTDQDLNAMTGDESYFGVKEQTAPKS